MKIITITLASLFALTVGCGATAPDTDDRRVDDTDAGPPCEPQPDASVIVDSCVENLHSSFACTQAQLPTVYTAIDCAGTPKQMHRESGTLIVRPDGRAGCVETTNYKGEHLTCCPACDVDRVPCVDGCCAK